MTHRSAPFLRRVPLLLGAIGLALGLAAPLRAAGPLVVVLPADGIVDNVLAGYLADGVSRAADDGAAAVVVRLDTPGGSLEATQKIVTAFLESPVPVIVWVAPAGTRAASAGTFITLAANIALMAPGTEIGAATPVDAQGNDIPGDLGNKVRNDAIAKIRSIAEARGRNAEWAASTVDKAVSSQASEAVRLGAVDGMAASLDEVLAFADGRTTKVAGGREVVIDLAGATTEERPMGPFASLIRILSDPNIAFVLFTIGFYGLLFELQNPNFVTGILGGLALILAFIGLGSLPFNVAGLILIGLGVVLLILEPTVTSHGLLTIGGVVSFVLGAAVLYSEPGNPFAPDVSVALPVLIAMAVLTGFFGILIAVTAVRTRRMLPPADVVGTMVRAGVTGKVRQAIEPLGSVLAAGEEWSARSIDGRPIQRGTSVRIVRQEGLTLLVQSDSAIQSSGSVTGPASQGGSAS